MITLLATLLFADPGWSFAAPRDTFSPDSLLDLRYLNEKTAGESGFVKRSNDGSDFVLGNGKPARFWAVTDYVQDLENPDELAHNARWLAKRGVNMVRFHGQLSPPGDHDKLTDVDTKQIDHCWRMVAAMKKEGIYSTISPYWAGPVGKKYIGWGAPEAGGADAWGLLFFDKKLQEGYKSWVRKLYATPNPYTGIPLAQDPAVAIIQIQNEDSLLFWTMQAVKGQQLLNLQELYGDWLIKQYGSLSAASQRWQGAAAEGDSFAGGRAGIYITWEMTQPQSGGKATRVADQLRFLGETMYAFNRDMADFYRKDLGCKQLINAGNWRTADTVRLNDVERWSYTANDVIGVNRYFDAGHKGPDEGWAIRVGDTFHDTSSLLDPRSLPFNLKQVHGFPIIISESEWVYPNKYQAEGPFLTAAYQSLTGVDALFWFGVGDTSEWHEPFSPKVGDWQPPLGKWSINTPMQLGMFPAAALTYRLGYLKQGKPAVEEKRAMADLWNRSTPFIAEEKSFDPNRDQGFSTAATNVKGGADPLAFLVGPVETTYGNAGASTATLSSFIDASTKLVKSNTGQLSLDYNTGLCIEDAPNVQGICGFLAKAGPKRLSDVTISSQNDYAAITLVSLDGKPIATSAKLLIQIGTTQRPTDWKDTPEKEGRKVVSVGTNPWLISPSLALVRVRNAGLRTATILDANGMAVGTATASASDGVLTVKLPENSMYVVLR